MPRKALLASGLLLLFSTAMLSFRAEAQQYEKVYRIGVLGAGTAAQNAERMDGFRQALREWVG